MGPAQYGQDQFLSRTHIAVNAANHAAAMTIAGKYVVTTDPNTTHTPNMTGTNAAAK
jgi:hypothetical protein